MTIFSDDPLSPALHTPLYQQLYTHLRTAILAGELKGGLKLPSTRALADELNISRSQYHYRFLCQPAKFSCLYLGQNNLLIN